MQPSEFRIPLYSGLTLSGREERRGLPTAGLVIEFFRGIWKSVAAKDGYVKDNMASRLVVSKSLGLWFLFFSGFSQALYLFF
ncbi:hypothetical protein pdam_00024542 [Pocillopora damicornis]|uniref:Uncharacterized protein n=1 Tax=Pocillopora damicornis TaxID=46731 RepID=A0A3M6UZC8_POCDA|nr:hypothetical protein pdam_00024542 [Pocillopora damicornis]